MGGQGGWVKSSGFSPNGLLPNESASVSQLLDTERWSEAEERTAELIARIQPNQPSVERRQAIASYVRRLITKCFSCQVFTFGSVPLKTYLPDGDIDLTAFSKNDDLKNNWANEVQDMLKREEKSEDAEFHVKEVQYIQAEVKIIKCLAENIVVDISFNQLGLCTLCFLEEVNQLISQIHLFKRSIILIKAWCYYESRTLGAHHGLISTYALEILVLYIFHVYNNSFSGPLEVLYHFLEFFSKFDWKNFCVSLWGPVPISSLPDMTGKPPLKDGGELLLSKVFLDACSSVYAVFPGGMENQDQPFVSKHFNVIDPLRTNNNLGRSVSKGNFFRIHSAFAFGAQRLARLLDCPKGNLIAEVNQFFSNTWDRHGKGPGYESASVRGSNSLLPGSASGQKAKDSSGDLPFTFYPTGPPVPFLTMLPLYNVPTETGTATASTNHSQSKLDHNLDLAEHLGRAIFSRSSARNKAAFVESSDECQSQILNGDFTSHWQNLQYGRLCQNTRHHVYPSSNAAPPVYSKEQFPCDGPGRPPSGNVNLLTQLMAYSPPIIPVSSLQPASIGPAGVYELYADEVPRYHGGTGTYLPNPKISSRDRQSWHTRNQSGYDREGNWNMKTKSRFAGRGQGRIQSEKHSKQWQIQ